MVHFWDLVNLRDCKFNLLYLLIVENNTNHKTLQLRYRLYVIMKTTKLKLYSFVKVINIII